MLMPSSGAGRVGMLFTDATHWDMSLEYDRPPRMTTFCAPAPRTALSNDAMPATEYVVPLSCAHDPPLTQQPQSVMNGSLNRSKMTDPLVANVVATWDQN